MEQWILWKPSIENLSATYHINSISDRIEGFILELIDDQDSTKRLIITFEDSIEAYRSVDEGFRLKTLELIKKQLDGKSYLPWAFFKVEHSDYLAWLSEQSYGITDSLTLQHFVFIGIDSIVDVISTYEPTFEFKQ